MAHPPFRRLPLLAVASLLLVASTSAPAPEGLSRTLLRLSDRKVLPLDAVVAGLPESRAIFVGELHNQPLHHDAQRELIAGLHEAGVELAVGLEMFEAGDQAALDAWVAGELPVDRFLPVYQRNWASPWALYREIFLYAREHGIPLVGLNLPREITSQVATRGFDSLSAEQKAALPGVRCSVDRVYEEFIRRALGDDAHGQQYFRTFCEAQMVWDTVMANRVTDYLDRHPGRRMVVLAGQGHAWKRGMPAQALRKSPAAKVTVILPELPGMLDRGNATTDDADYLWLGITRLPRGGGRVGP